MEVNKNNFRELIKKKDFRTLKVSLNQMNNVQLAKIIEEMSPTEEIIMYRLLDRRLSKEVFKHLSTNKKKEVIKGLLENDLKLSNLINDIEPDDRTAFFEELPKDVTESLLQLLTEEEREIAVKLLGYPKDSIGRLMTPEYIAMKAEDSIADTLLYIRKNGKDSETLNVIYAVDQDWKLIGDVRIKSLLLASPEQTIGEIMERDFIALNPKEDQEIAVKVFKDYDRVALPVIDESGKLIGITTFDDIMDIEEEESTEDFHKFGAFQSAVSNPLNARIFNLYKQRILWLLALVFMNIFSGTAIASFEDVLQATVSLVFFLPLLIDSGGNAGAQSATLMIRSLAMGDVKLADWYKLIFKELLVSLLLGVTMALGVSLVASFRAPEIVMVVAATMVLIVMTGSVIGMLLPFIFTKFKLDPATASAPLITSISDICGVLIYFSIASWYLGF
ncbi:magnesium transporter [Weeksellaceae bacterium KMM 9713]|uniref:Magnesium transporter MgtE n=1 Tax=Profundicola chukchiensis TaxID=2961959 RepID=A0A9X4RWN9_9FLAO|nr:magnesium transporter [Profundicola chukchiensis]MDG4946047.1 magnesium transporter [Profundicola chukchiensis]